MKYRREGCSPENCNGKEPRASDCPQATVRQAKRRARRTHPGSQTSPSSTGRTCGNHGDPGGRAEGAAQPLTSLKSEEEVESVGKSEPSVVATKSGNSDGAKGRQYWDSESIANMPRHRADYEHDH
jgi:hypothetical protein